MERVVNGGVGMKRCDEEERENERRPTWVIERSGEEIEERMGFYKLEEKGRKILNGNSGLKLNE